MGQRRQFMVRKSCLSPAHAASHPYLRVKALAGATAMPISSCHSTGRLFLKSLNALGAIPSFSSVPALHTSSDAGATRKSAK